MDTKPTATIVNGIKLEQGRIYLRDRRNGRVFQYEEALSQLGYIERFLFEGTVPEREPLNITKVTLSGIEKAAEWDRLASMTNAEREAELERKRRYEDEQRALKEKLDNAEASVITAPEEPPTSDEYSDGEVELVDKQGPKLESYRANGWTNEQLVAANLATKK